MTGQERFAEVDRLLARAADFVDLARRTADAGNDAAFAAAQWSAVHMVTIAQANATLAVAEQQAKAAEALRHIASAFGQFFDEDDHPTAPPPVRVL